MTLDTVDIAVEFEGFRAVKEFHILAANENHEFGEWGRSTASQAAQHAPPQNHRHASHSSFERQELAPHS
jgi:hypothetical protein